MSVSTRQLEVFVAVLDHGGFSTAADQLRMSQPAVSHTLAAGEKVLQGSLLHRGHIIEATALGKVVLPHARAVLAAARGLEAAVDTHVHRGTSGLVRLAAPPTVSH